MYQIQRDLKVSPLLCCMEGNVLGLMEEPHVEDNHKEGADLQVLVKRYKEDNFGQSLIKVERKDEVLFSTRKRDDSIPHGSEKKKFLIHPLIGWIETPLE